MCHSDCKNTTCPFAFTEASEVVQNFGCLPSPIDILAMRVAHGKTWACHSDPTKPCAGGLHYLKLIDQDARIINTPLITEKNITSDDVTFPKHIVDGLRESLTNKADF